MDSCSLSHNACFCSAPVATEQQLITHILWVTLVIVVANFLTVTCLIRDRKKKVYPMAVYIKSSGENDEDTDDDDDDADENDNNDEDKNTSDKEENEFAADESNDDDDKDEDNDNDEDGSETLEPPPLVTSSSGDENDDDDDNAHDGEEQAPVDEDEVAPKNDIFVIK